MRNDATSTGLTIDPLATPSPRRPRPARTSNLLRAIPDVAFELDADGIYVDFAGREEDRPLSSHDFLGRSITETMPPDVAHRALAALARLREHGGTERFEYALSTSDGLHWYEARMRALPHGGASAYVRDITEQKSAQWRCRESEERFQALEASIQARTLDLELANRELEAFSYSVAHDLRAPLRAIGGFTRLLLDRQAEGFDSLNVHYFERVCAAARHMDRLITDLLRLAQVSRTELATEEVDIAAIATDIVTHLQQSGRHHDPRVTIHSPMRVRGDAGLLRILLENLIGNAWKFTSATTDSEIEIGILEQGDTRVCFVRDNGAGFDMQYADHLFSAFQRLHSPHQFEGTGIGLAMAERIIERHHGRIWAEAKPEEGATFYFALPNTTATDR